MFFVQLNGVNLAVVDVPSTGGWYDWENVIIPNVQVFEGEQFFKIQLVQAGFNIERIKFESLASVYDESMVINGFSIGEPYPNPFNPKVNIELSVHEKREHIAKIYGIRGNLIRNINLGILDKGNFSLSWDGKDNYGKKVNSGVYLLRVGNTINFEEKKIILLK